MESRSGWMKLSMVAVLICGLLASSALAASQFGHHGKRLVTGLGSVREVLAYPKSRTLVISEGESAGLITRLRADGSVDRSFGVNGQIKIRSNAVAVQPNGKILVLSTQSRSDGKDPLLTRLRADGSVDTSFARAGEAVIDLGNTFDEGAAMSLLAGGKIAVAGRSGPRTEARVDVITGGDVVVARLFSNGSADPSFGVGGRSHLDSREEVISLKAGPQGYVYLATGGSLRRLTRLRENGEIDSSFGQNGVLTLPSEIEPPGTTFLPTDDFAVLSGGGVLAGGTIAATGEGGLRSKAGVLRYRPDGSPNPSFGNGGFARVGFRGYTFVNGLAATADGRPVIVAGSQVPAGNQSRLSAIVLTSRGKFDKSFGRGGKVRIQFGEWVNGERLVVQGNRVLLVGGLFGSYKTLFAQVPLVRRR